MSKKKMKVYLCGPMEICPDGGVQWRDRITPKLEAMGVEVLNPAKNEVEKTGYTFHELRDKLRAWKLSGNFEEYDKALAKIVKFDIEDVDASTFIIAYYDELVPFKDKELVEKYLKENDSRDFQGLLEGFIHFLGREGCRKMAMGGTICEVWHAYEKKIPVYTVTYNTLSTINDWLHFTLRDAGKIFPSFNQLMEYVEKKYK